MGHILSTPVESKWIERHGNKWLRVGVAEMQGYRVNMEDTAAVCVSLPSHKDIALFGIFDGHSGTAASVYMRDNIINKIDSLSDPTDQSQLRQAIIEMDAAFCKDVDRRMNGCTACIAVVTAIQNGRVTPLPASDNASSSSTLANNSPQPHKLKPSQSSASQQKQRYKVLFASVGDSRAILIEPNGDISGVTTDHKPDMAAERQRIIAAGGTVSLGRVDGELAMSRAIGDWSYKTDTKLPVDQQKVTPVPDIIELTADETDEILICCDGLFEKLTTEQVGAFVHFASKTNDDKTKADPSAICSMLCDYSLAKGSKDNMSAMLIQFTDGTSYQQRNSGELVAGSLEQVDVDSDRKYIDTYVDYAKMHIPHITFDTLRSMAIDTDNDRARHLQQLDALDASMEEWKLTQKKRGAWHENENEDDTIM